MKYRITNTTRVIKSFEADNGSTVHVSPGETRTLKSRPPEDEPGWKVELLEEPSKSEVEDKLDDGGE